MLAPTHEDPRIALAREAIEFWKATFVDLGIPPVLREAEVIVASPNARALENYARRIHQRAGRPAAGSFEPLPPAELSALGADVVVLLSTQPIMPFAWPVKRDERHFVAIPADSPEEPDPPIVTRNVIAHELGHTVGLRHHRDPRTMMCVPCRTESLRSGEREFLPLTKGDNARLIELHSGR